LHKHIFETCLPLYSNVFYIPVEFDLVNDNFRDMSKSFQAEIVDSFNTVFDFYKIKPTILKGTVEERKELFINKILF